jgi:hypothetical protein
MESLRLTGESPGQSWKSFQIAGAILSQSPGTFSVAWEKYPYRMLMESGGSFNNLWRISRRVSEIHRILWEYPGAFGESLKTVLELLSECLWHLVSLSNFRKSRVIVLEILLEYWRGTDNRLIRINWIDILGVQTIHRFGHQSGPGK